jgi:hypothetical protein
VYLIESKTGFNLEILNYLINDPEIGLHDKSFIIIPSEEIQNPDSLLIENLVGFEIVYKI